MRSLRYLLLTFPLLLAGCGGEELSSPDTMPASFEARAAAREWSGLAEWGGLHEAVHPASDAPATAPDMLNGQTRQLAQVRRRLDRAITMIAADSRNVDALCRNAEAVADAGRILEGAGQAQEARAAQLREALVARDGKLAALEGDAPALMGDQAAALRRRTLGIRDALDRLTTEVTVTAQSAANLRQLTDGAPRLCDAYQSLQTPD